jgi:6-phosphogluconate dehydrogenase (decarboxylating)
MVGRRMSDARATSATLQKFGGAASSTMAVAEAVAAKVLAVVSFTPLRSCHEHPFEEKSLSTMRFGLGGHLERLLHRK